MRIVLGEVSMSAITSTVSAYGVPIRYFSVNNRNTSGPSPPVAPLPLPQREADLNQELDKRLSGEITRIRRQINSSTSSTGTQSSTLGSSLDIRV